MFGAFGADKIPLSEERASGDRVAVGETGQRIEESGRSGGIGGETHRVGLIRDGDQRETRQLG